MDDDFFSGVDSQVKRLKSDEDFFSGVKAAPPKLAPRGGVVPPNAGANLGTETVSATPAIQQVKDVANAVYNETLARNEEETRALLGLSDPTAGGTVQGVADMRPELPKLGFNIREEDYGMRALVSLGRNDNERNLHFKKFYPEGEITRAPNGHLYARESLNHPWQRYSANWLGDDPNETSVKAVDNARDLADLGLQIGAGALTGPAGGVVAGLIAELGVDGFNRLYRTNDQNWEKTAGDTAIRLGLDTAGGFAWPLAGRIGRAIKGGGLFNTTEATQNVWDTMVDKQIRPLIMAQISDAPLIKRTTALIAGLSKQIEDIQSQQYKDTAKAMVNDLVNFELDAQSKAEVRDILINRYQLTANQADAAISKNVNDIKTNLAGSVLKGRELSEVVKEYEGKLLAPMTAYTTNMNDAGKAAERLIKEYSQVSKVKENELYGKFLGAYQDKVKFNIDEAKGIAKNIYDNFKFEMSDEAIVNKFRNDLATNKLAGTTDEQWAYSLGRRPTDEDIINYLGPQMKKSRIGGIQDLPEHHPLKQLVQDLTDAKSEQSLNVVQNFRSRIVQHVLDEAEGATFNNAQMRNSKEILGALSNALDNPIAASEAVTARDLANFRAASGEARAFSRKRYDLLDTAIASRAVSAELPDMIGLLIDNKGRAEGLIKFQKMADQLDILSKSDIGKQYFNNIQNAFAGELLSRDKTSVWKAIEAMENNPTSKRTLDILMPSYNQRQALKNSSKMYDEYVNSGVKQIVDSAAPTVDKVSDILYLTTGGQQSKSARAALANQIRAIANQAEPGVPLAHTKLANLFVDTAYNNLVNDVVNMAALKTTSAAEINAFKEGTKKTVEKINNFVDNVENSPLRDIFTNKKLEDLKNYRDVLNKINLNFDPGINLQSADLTAKMGRLDVGAIARALYITQVQGPLLTNPTFTKMIYNVGKNRVDPLTQSALAFGPPAIFREQLQNKYGEDVVPLLERAMEAYWDEIKTNPQIWTGKELRKAN